MPPPRKIKNVRKYKRYGAKTKMVAKPKVTVQRNIVTLGKGFPKKMLVSHKFTEIITVTSPGTGQLYNFSANGMYDPNITGTGTQPLLFDQMSLLYSKYHVIGSKAKITFMNNGSATVPITVLLYLNDDVGVTSTNPILMAQQNNTKINFILPNAAKPTVLGARFSAKKNFGKGTLADDLMSGTIVANPTEQMYYSLLIRTTDQVTTTSTIAYIEIEYIAVWTELNDVALS